MRAPPPHVLLRHTPLGIALLLGACGGAAGGSLPPQQPTTGASAAPSEAPPSVGSAAPAPSGALMPITAAPVEMKSPIPTGLAADLNALGLDPKNLPPIAKLEPRALRGVMKLIAKSLGAKCGDCHQEGDFAATTKRKRVATHMWDDFVVRLALADGSPLFCDSCHQGRIQQLDRRDKKALAKWMDANFVDKLARKDNRSHECETCHVDMEMNLIATWSK